MTNFNTTEQRIDVISERFPALPKQQVILGRLIRHIQKVQQDQSNTILREWNLHLPQYNALMMLYGTEGFSMNVSQLAEATGEKLANVTRLTNSLVEKGLVERIHNTEDRRIITLMLSPSGLAILGQVLPPLCKMVSIQMSELSNHEQVQLESLLKKALAGMVPPDCN